MGRALNSARTASFDRRRTEILDVASHLINRAGACGMTLTAVARALDLDTSSVAYYFKRREALAAACLERTVVWMHDAATTAAAMPDPASRVRAFMAAHFALVSRQRTPGAAQLAMLSDMGSIGAEARRPLEELYVEMLRTVRHFFAPYGREHALIAATLLIAVVHWMSAWQADYLDHDLARAEERVFDILARGLGTSDWDVSGVVPALPASGDARQRFLRAATSLINRHGYGGASVERIAAELGVSTGSFYHHLENKDELVLACFRRSFETLERAQEIGDEGGGSHGERLARTMASIFAVQMGDESPLLRSSAYQALPLDLRDRALRRTNQINRHFAGSIADGIADGSLRAVDPMLGAHVVLSAVNAAYELRRWAVRHGVEPIAGQLLAALRNGILPLA